MSTNNEEIVYRISYFRVFLAVLILAGLIAGGVFWFLKGKEGEKTLKLEYGELTLSNTYTAISVRNEKIVYSASTGSTTYLSTDGKVVDTDEVILKIKREEGVAEEQRGDVNFEKSSITLQKLEEELKALRSDVIHDVRRGDVQEAMRKKQEYLAKAEVLGKAKTSKADEKLAKEQYLGNDEVSVFSQLRGVLSFQLDGYENAASLANIFTFDFSQINNFEPLISMVKGNVKRGDPIYKIVDDSNYYLAFTVPTEHNPTGYPEVAYFEVRVGNQTVKANYYDSFPQSNYYVVILRLEEPFASFYSTRVHLAEIVLKGYKGLLVPKTALVIENGQTGVYRVGAERMVEFVPVKVLKTDTDSAIIQHGTFYNADLELVTSVSIGQEIVKRSDEYKPGEKVH